MLKRSIYIAALTALLPIGLLAEDDKYSGQLSGSAMRLMSVILPVGNTNSAFAFDNCGFSGQPGFYTNVNAMAIQDITFTLGNVTTMRRFTNWSAKKPEFRVKKVRVYGKYGVTALESHTMTISQGDSTVYRAGSVESRPCVVTTSIYDAKIYGKNYPSDANDYSRTGAYYEYCFESIHSFSTERPITIKFNNVTSSTNPFTAISPSDSALVTDAGTPAMAFEGEWVDRPDSINLNFVNSFGSGRSGHLHEQPVGGFLGYHDNSTFENIRFPNGTATVEARYAHSTNTVSVKVAADNSYNVFNKDVSASGSYPLIEDYIDDGGTAAITVSGIKFRYYSVIIYQATDTEGAGFWPPMLNNICYSYDGSMSTTNLNVAGYGYGLSKNLDPTIGINMVCPNAVFTNNADKELIVQLATNGVDSARDTTNKRCRGCIAAIQIIEVKR